eukprot:Gb_06016 [translate_table: standard]
MELGLGLGEDRSVGEGNIGHRRVIMPKSASNIQFENMKEKGVEDQNNTPLGLRMGLGITVGRDEYEQGCSHRQNANPPVQLDLLPLAPVPRDSSQLALSWQPLMKASASENGNCEGEYAETRSSGHGVSPRGFDVNQIPSPADNDDDAVVSSPNSTVSSFQMDFAMYPGSHATSVKRERENNSNEHDLDRACSRASDEEEGAATRKKLRLSKEQSAYLEESFKEHNTLNPKQKLALAKQLNLRPRQVEVWFQNRRARTKLKQTEVDCEYLKRCCETLTEENRRLQKELQELRALKVAHPFYMQLPATTLTMCPSCERVATADNSNKGTFPLAKPRFYPFSQSSAAS